eukprot:TRINITY_DN20362_c0_g1_i3.p1 TRINITY_DN20362_c0_g1~~TRINITY_DN20362_c0_g1_i3.p1  ORF type:complete len:331 (+),score=118.23 TRINITY_DN20362_c0_g1_i3:39-995(+)
MRRAAIGVCKGPAAQDVAHLSCTRRWAGARSYQNYLRLLQNQTLREGDLLLEGKTESGELAVRPDQPQVKFVSYNQLVAAPEAPKDPVMMFRDIDNLRQLAEASGSTLHLGDTDCSTLCMDLFEEVRRGRRLTKDIVRIFEKMENHPDFYRVRKKAYNIMIYNSLAREYPALETPAKLYGNLLEKDGKAGLWTYTCLSRVQMFLPPVERPDYQKAFLNEIALLEDRGAIAPLEAQRARTFIKNLHWITDGARYIVYAIGLCASVLLLQYAYEYRRVGRQEREVLENEIFKALEEQYHGVSISLSAGKESNSDAPSNGE